jgi:hypothetical protein
MTLNTFDKYIDSCALCFFEWIITMLKRIQKIQNIGRFVDCHSAGCEFLQETIIFGYNTQGKSTLTAILRSIQTGNNDILIGRKTFGATGNKKVEIDFEEAGANDAYIFTNAHGIK